MIKVERADLDRRDQVDEAVELLGRFAAESGHPLHWSVAHSLPDLFRRREVILLLARIDGVAVGYALCQRTLVSFRGMEALNLHDIFVTETARGQGIGQHLLEAARDQAVALGCTRVTLEVAADNLAARKLYGRMGFDLPEEGADETHFLAADLD
ncbi:MAG: GNAT family N-acetyltransferase [Phycisphaerales bacterium]|nr:GNAT family N-acetyltransferase [Phycisphaerales bacterium]